MRVYVRPSSPTHKLETDSLPAQARKWIHCCLPRGELATESRTFMSDTIFLMLAFARVLSICLVMETRSPIRKSCAAFVLVFISLGPFTCARAYLGFRV